MPNLKQVEDVRGIAELILRRAYSPTARLPNRVFPMLRVEPASLRLHDRGIAPRYGILTADIFAGDKVAVGAAR